jgi:hypothetical protein
VEIARAQARAGDIDAALATAQAIEDVSGTRAAILGEIATAPTAAGDAEGARTTLADALANAGAGAGPGSRTAV